jgi:hypothetical protein
MVIGLQGHSGNKILTPEIHQGALDAGLGTFLAKPGPAGNNISHHAGVQARVDFATSGVQAHGGRIVGSAALELAAIAVVQGGLIVERTGEVETPDGFAL